jgi:hypothetical protein
MRLFLLEAGDGRYDKEYSAWMQAAVEDPIQAARDFANALQKSAKKNKRVLQTIKKLEQIADGDQTAWQYGSGNASEAVQFAISNTLMRGMGLGVLPPGGGMRESVEVANIVGGMISEDVDFDPLSEMQRKCKRIAESYGFAVFTLNEEDCDMEDEDEDEDEDY